MYFNVIDIKVDVYFNTFGDISSYLGAADLRVFKEFIILVWFPGAEYIRKAGELC